MNMHNLSKLMREAKPLVKTMERKRLEDLADIWEDLIEAEAVDNYNDAYAFPLNKTQSYIYDGLWHLKNPLPINIDLTFIWATGEGAVCLRKDGVNIPRAEYRVTRKS